MFLTMPCQDASPEDNAESIAQESPLRESKLNQRRRSFFDSRAHQYIQCTSVGKLLGSGKGSQSSIG